MTVRAGGPALLLGLAMILTGCRGADPPPAEPAAAGADLEDPADPRLDIALSRPRADSVYPEVGDPGIDVLHYDLDLSWDTEETTLTASATLLLRATRDASVLRLDLGAPLSVSRVRLDGAEVDVEHRGKDLLIRTRVRAEGRHRLEVDYSGTPEPVPAPSDRGDLTELGFNLSSHDEVWTLQEPYGAYTWYPVNDHPSDKALYDITIAVDSDWVGVANGRQIADETREGQRVTSYRLDEPAASYLITLAIGDYQHETDETSSGVPLNYWVPRRFSQTWPQVRRTAEAVEWVEETLGPWPFSSAGTVVVDSLSGMETQTLITLGATEYTLSDEVLVHEMVHQYYGDQVTPKDWRDLWLNEGMATYLQAVYRSETTSESLETALKGWAAIDAELRAEAGPPGDYDPRLFGHANVYYSPALMWHELRAVLGERDFWRVVRGWPREHDNGNADREDFLTYLEAETGRDLTGLVTEWLESPRTPSRRG